MSHIAADPQPQILPSLQARRDAGLSRWQQAGLPTPRLEAWKHTSLRAVSRSIAEPTVQTAPHNITESPTTAQQALSGTSGMLVLVNGTFDRAQSSLPAGVTVVDLADTAPDLLGNVAPIDRLEDALNARNISIFDRGIGISIAANTVIDAPLELRYLYDVTTGATIESRLLVTIAHHGQLSIVEHHQSAADQTFLVNHVVEIALEDGAILRHAQVQRQSQKAFHLQKVAVRQRRHSRYEAQVAQFGAAIGRSDIEVFLTEPGASCQLDGFYHGQGKQHLDNHSTIHHLADETRSGEHYKGVLDDASTGIFRGNVLIYPNARGCATVQLNRNLLLSDRATVHSKPQLEIDNDDVTASHGATIGQLDEDALFYLRSRGIATGEARRLLIFAFAAEILAQITLPELEEMLRDELADRLSGLAMSGLALGGSADTTSPNEN